MAPGRTRATGRSRELPWKSVTHPMTSIHSALAEFLDQRRSRITGEWLRRVRADRKIPAADNLPREQLIDHLPFLLTALIERLRGTSATSADETRHHSQTHGETRQDQNYRLPELLREVSILRNVLIEEWSEFDAAHGSGRHVQLESSAILHAILDGVIAETTIGFVTREREKLVAANLALEESNLRMQDLNARLADLDERRLRMLRTIAHEISNHLHATGFMVAFLKKSPDAEAAESSAAILRSIGAMNDLMNQLLEFSTLTAAEEKAIPTNVEPAAFLAEIAPFGRSLAAERRLGFLEDFADAPKTVVTDVNILRRVCFNLLTNAAKYTAGGHIGLAVSADDTHWEIAVSDTGCGIPPEESERIFAEFYRAAAARFTPNGVGLGLAITRQLVQLLGGTITLESTVGQGSTFRVRLPIAGGGDRPAAEARTLRGP